MNKKIILLICLLILSGCNPEIKEITSSQDMISSGDSFKLFVTISNPLKVEYKPFLSLKYDKDIFYHSFYPYSSSKDKKISLESIPIKGEKSYLLQFSTDSDVEAGSFPIKIYLYGEEEAKEFLDSAEKKINIVSRP